MIRAERAGGREARGAKQRLPIKAAMLKFFTIVLFLFTSAALIGCGPSLTNIRFKVNSEPEGAHLVYRLSPMLDPESMDSGQPLLSDWIYLGNTPFQGIRRINDDLLIDSTKVTLKVMRAGYYDQVKEWDGASFFEEAETRGQIFWTPRLIAH